MANLLLVEDHTLLRQAIALAIARNLEMLTVLQAGSLAEARRLLDDGNGTSVDIAIVDLSLPDGDGIDLIRDLHARNPGTMVMVLTASLEPLEYARAVEGGAAGVLHKSASLDDIDRSVRRLQEGEWLLPPAEIVRMLRLATHHRMQEHEAEAIIAQLTAREREVLDALADGLSSKDIAAQLSMTVETERTHMVNILSKLGVHSRLQALVFALRHGVVNIR